MTEETKNMNEEIKDQLNMDIIRKIVEDNEAVFTVNGTKYRVQGLSFEQRRQVHERKIEKYNEYISAKDSKGEPKYRSEEDLKKFHKARGTDLELLRKKVMELNKEKEDLQMKLGEEVKLNSDEGKMKRLAEQIKKLDAEMTELSNIRAKHLEYCIENMVMIDAFSYIIYLITEKFVEDKYVPAWSSYQEFGREKESLINRIAIYVSLIASPNLEL